MRILFVSDEVSPYTSSSITAHLARHLPERLQDTGDYEVRIMMPRYGTISERRNRLHEVIRLSGTKIELGDTSEILKVKVASIPGIRLQVYFLDSKNYFKRKGIYANKQEKLFDDNPARALFLAHAAFETIRKLGWSPDVVHGMGWLAGFVPIMLRTSFAGDPLFEEARSIYTPNEVDFEAPLTEEMLASLGLDGDSRLVDAELPDAAAAYADAVLYPAGAEANGDAFQLTGEDEEMVNDAVAAYEAVLNEVPA